MIAGSGLSDKGSPMPAGALAAESTAEMSTTVRSRKPRSSSTPVKGDAPLPTSLRASAAEIPAQSSIRSDMAGCSSSQVRVSSPRA